jgi:hypothetical protein
MKILLLLALVILEGQAFAAWASGGGKIHRDGHNPWFLENTRNIRYCVDIDEVNFGVSAREASSQVRFAIEDWIDAFVTAEDDYYEEGALQPYGQLRLGTQRFEEYGCSSPNIDLRFQFGRLTPEQEALFSNPKEFVGIAVRTDYDKVNLRGKGFIYLSPTSGPLSPNHPRMHFNAWHEHDYFSLKYVLRHELGHVFGVDHQSDSVMDEKWPELFVDRNFLDEMTPPVHQYFGRRASIIRLLGLKKNWLVDGCGSRNPVFAPNIFHTQYSEDACGRVELNGNQLTIQFKEDQQNRYETIGTSTITNTHVNSSPAVSVYLPEEQKVFTSIPEEARLLGRLFGESKNDNQKWTGRLLIKATSEFLPLQIEADNASASGTVLKNDIFENDAFFLE